MARSVHVPVNFRDNKQRAIIAFDRRKERRHRVLKEALIVLNNGHSTMSCVVRDISEGGARLRVPWIYGLPEAFQLTIKGESQVREVRKVWAAGQEMGVRFVGTGRPIPAKLDKFE